MTFNLVQLDPHAVEFNPWNPNVMSPEVFAKELRSIEEYGFIDPITVRTLESGTRQVIDGAHRVRAARQLGLATIPVVDLGALPDAKAKKLTIIANELRGTAQTDLLAILMKDLAATETSEALAASLPFSSVEIETLLVSAEHYDWGEQGPPAALAADTSEAGVGAVQLVKVSDAPFRLGTVKGALPKALAAKLLVLWEQTAARIGSNTPESVLSDWLSLLQGAMPVAPSAAPAPKKGKGKRAQGAS